jgi:hypothetical protein
MNETTPNTTATGGATPSSCGEAAAGWRGVLPVIAAGMSADLLEDVGVTVGGVTIHADETGTARISIAGVPRWPDEGTISKHLDRQGVAALHAALGALLASWTEAN